MEMEQKQEQNLQEIARNELISIIKSTFNASTPQEQKSSEQSVMNLLKTPDFFQKLYVLLTDPTNLQGKKQLDKAAAVLIKKYAYDYSKSSDDKSQFIQMLFSLILCERVDFAAKELLGTALEYQFNEDQGNMYRKTVIDKVLEMLQVPENVNSFEGIIIVCIAYLNSLVEVEEQITFFQYSIGNINFAALNLLKEIHKISLEEWVLCDKIIMPKITKLFEYIQTAIERVIDEQGYFDLELKSIRENVFLISTIENYLQLFHNNGSLISLAYPQINEVKRMMLNVICHLYANYKCPSKIFNTIYITFLMECQYTGRDCTSESIIMSCIEVLSMHLEKRHYYKIFCDNLTQTILALFMYSTTSKQEYQALVNNPEEFSDIAEYYINADIKFYNLKVKAAIFLQVVAEKIDEALRQLLQIFIVIMAGALQTSSSDSPVMSEVKSETSKFNFYGLTSEQKLETSLMMLCTLSSYIHRRHDIANIIYAFFISQFQVLVKTSSPIVILRLMRAISCYSISLYFSYIEAQIRKGKVFMVEGLKSFEKILKTNRISEIFQYLAKIMTGLVSELSITDSLMQLIALNNFETMVKNSPQLYSAVIKRIKDEFYINKTNDEHATLICFNLLHALIKKQSTQDYCHALMQLFFQFSQDLQLPENRVEWQKYDQKIVEIYELVITKSSYIPEQVDGFVKVSLNNLWTLEKGTQYFRFYSLYIFKLSGATYKLQPLFNAFWKETKVRFQNYLATKNYNEGISYFCFLLSEIMANYCKIDLSESDLKYLLAMTQKVPSEHKQYPLIVFLTHLYLLPYPVCTFLKQNNFYEGFLVEVVKVHFDGSLIKRIFILSLIKLLQIEDNTANFINILVYCIDHLKKQCGKAKKKKENIINELRPRKLIDEKFIEKEQECIQVEKNDNELVNLFVKFHHPFGTMSEFDQFKVIFWQNDQHVGQLSPQLRADLKAILETEWVDNKIRRIVHIKK